MFLMNVATTDKQSHHYRCRYRLRLKADVDLYQLLAENFHYLSRYHVDCFQGSADRYQRIHPFICTDHKSN